MVVSYECGVSVLCVLSDKSGMKNAALIIARLIFFFTGQLNADGNKKAASKFDAA
jgi:hypothetical protein